MLITGIESPCNRRGPPNTLKVAGGAFRQDLSHAPKDSLLALEGCVGSSSCHIVDREPRWSPHAGVDFWSFVELQPLGVDYDVPGGVAYP
ncbi:hypothetical protein BHE74_00036965 [Ensete ventricosum]|nr:hypothetical protein BHE74_00036965 [Ensete ventricosum]RZS18781.1 hypothetical protein BHM03_00051105 [Ensete ventricosum]